ncbi:hypothetical protein [Bacillus thuringiensis]|uniref:hypothetical protein n=1 Tax=Bacillus thuringiensis TaxID=1428 RepID=UPI001145E221|nr:hypothetical protein [Bacillus thuringiensis]
MMDRIKNFCNLIGEEYVYYLYEYFNIENSGELNQFPWCCHASANLIASYLFVHFDKNFVHKKFPAHGVTMNKECVIDFTDFQFYLDEDLKRKFHDFERLFTKEEIYSLVQSQPIIHEKNSNDFLVYDSSPHICTLYGIEFAKKIKNPETLEGFMQYVKSAIKTVGTKVVNAGLY